MSVFPHRCNYLGCDARTTERFCPAHKALAAREYNQTRRSPDANALYGRRWRTIRDAYIARHPLCELCETAGLLVPAEQVHHKLPLDQGGTNDDANLQSLCASCHSRITITETNRRH
jgi:5-methylcytosine-specific restriction protein A